MIYVDDIEYRPKKHEPILWVDAKTWLLSNSTESNKQQKILQPT